ncbi:MAG: sulfatase-like hydrolase/transferase [Gemmatimonadetes bacterium]|jgi:arylsulfatase A-like enzyme|nr:sulfatase-like hydrolase/transferase [Gemmatimonadota bacterium]MBT4612542.1 sulfatase-like hydrolase/transferase [Gemmatimonadota bacterium]MBT5056936.1 sulfatase-like hydrolase/transferase [Gemmatimonadota bacterium]MBT5142189.1 sulfatase-like hydrolase/transferase [Gemmatimonadota bacterium]MBT5589226.1 sulfatase-like hydrolase/transferase [Gemmatimonadota bacterium]
MNVLFILTDQFRFDCLSALGHPVVRTPNLDALATDSTLFTNTWCPTMACAPVRASLFTGYYADTHGMGGNQTVLDPPDRKVLPEYLADAGYDTALVGKLHLKPMQRAFGFRHLQRHDAPYTNYSAEEAADSAYIRYLGETAFQHDAQEAVRRFTEDEACQHTDEERFILGSGFLDTEHHEVSWAVRESIQYLRHERDTDKPFFLNCSIFGPHQPYLCPAPWDQLYPSETIPLPTDFHYGVDDKPIFMDSPQMEWQARRDSLGWNEATYQRLLSAYYGYVSMIDEGVGQLMMTLREEGLFDDTLIVFSADHGEFGGQFRAFYKGLPYEASCHVPLIIRDPRDSGGRRCSQNTSNIDLFSTILNTAGVDPPHDIESRDLTDLVSGNESTWDNRTVWKKGNQSFLVRDASKLVRGNVGGHDVYELYDLGVDPLEERNLIDDVDQSSAISALRQELDAWHQDQDDKGRARVGAS